METKNGMPCQKVRSLEEAISEVSRECQVRKRCFPAWIEQGRVGRVDAQDRLDRLATALALLVAIASDTTVLSWSATILAEADVSKADASAAPF
jgi:hypothetical protein